MKLLSIQQIISQIKETIFRFPLASLIAVAGTFSGIYLIDNEKPEIQRLLLSLIVSFFLAVAVTIFSERKKISELLPSGAVIIFLVGYYYWLPKEINLMRAIDFYQWALLNFIFVLLIMLAPFFVKNEINGFWQHCKKLFTRLFFVGVSTGTLYIGIVLSLISIKYLFDVDVEKEWFLRIWIVVVGLVATQMFLSGIAKEYSLLESLEDYPKVIEIFAKYILLPLLVLYLVILYVYAAKILFTGEWPKGQVAWMVTIFSTIGIITMLLLYPLRKQEQWPVVLSKAFFISIIPLLALLFKAVSIRIGQYGLTENRVALIYLGIWLLGLSLYFLLSKKYNIKIIFISLAVIALIFSFGPLSAFNISKRDQIFRLRILLQNNKILVNGKIQKVDKKSVSQEDQYQIDSLVRYLYGVRGLDDIKSWWEEDIDLEGRYVYDARDNVLNSMGLRDDGQSAMTNLREKGYYSFDLEHNYFEKSVRNIEGYQQLVSFDCYNACEAPASITSGGQKVYSFLVDKNTQLFILKDAADRNLVQVDLKDKVDALIRDYPNEGDLPLDQMTLEAQENGYKVQVWLERLSVEKSGGQFRVSDMEGEMAIGQIK